MKYGESMIAMLKLLATLGNKFVSQLGKGRCPYFGNLDFWSSYSDAMRQLATLKLNSAAEFEESRQLAEYVLE